MRCSVCGTETQSPFCPNCGTAMQSPVNPAGGDPPVIAVLRQHARSSVMKAVLILLAVSAVLQAALIAAGHTGLITLSINGQPSRVGSLGLLALVLLSFWRLYRAAGQGPGNRLPTAPATVAKVLAIIALIFACLLTLGALAAALALFVPGSALVSEISKQLQEMLPDGSFDVSTILTVGFLVLALLSILELLTTVSLLRTVNAAKQMLRTGMAARLSKLSAVTLLINAGLLVLLSLLNLSTDGFWGLLNNLPLAACLVCFALLILRAKADLDRVFAPAQPVPPAGPELK